MNLCISRFGSVMNTVLSPRIARRFSVPAAVWCGTLSCYCSFVAVILLVSLMSKSRSTEPFYIPVPETQQQESSESSNVVFERKIDIPDIPQSLFSSMRLLPAAFWILCAICILLYGTVVPFNTIASDFLMSKWYPGDTQMAGFVMR